MKQIIGDYEAFIYKTDLGLKKDGLSVKFHKQPLGAVVKIEQRLAKTNEILG